VTWKAYPAHQRTGTTKELTMNAHPVRRLTTAALLLAAWLVLAASAAHANVPPPDDPDARAVVFVTQPSAVVIESVSWTRYALVAAIACVIGIAATLAVRAVLQHSHHTAAAQA
jgi:hypothetical protein